MGLITPPCARARRWHSYSVGNGLPFLAHSPGMARGFPIGFTTRGRELVTVNLSDPSLPTWVAVITGRQGAGKTFLTQLLTLHTLYENGRAAIVDRAGHYRTLIDLVGGTYITVWPILEAACRRRYHLAGDQIIVTIVDPFDHVEELPSVLLPGSKLVHRTLVPGGGLIACIVRAPLPPRRPPEVSPCPLIEDRTPLAHAATLVKEPAPCSAMGHDMKNVDSGTASLYALRAAKARHSAAKRSALSTAKSM